MVLESRMGRISCRPRERRLDEKVVSLSNTLDILKDIEEEKEVAQKKEKK